LIFHNKSGVPIPETETTLELSGSNEIWNRGGFGVPAGSGGRIAAAPPIDEFGEVAETPELETEAEGVVCVVEAPTVVAVGCDEETELDPEAEPGRGMVDFLLKIL